MEKGKKTISLPGVAFTGATGSRTPGWEGRQSSSIPTTTCASRKVVFLEGKLAICMASPAYLFKLPTKTVDESTAKFRNSPSHVVIHSLCL